ncbi:alpha/beta hydrolase [Actinacidiphila yeochonensis]|uniref:alpha/beta hydrolase n=1 Tax=Actinacidiphila yeochonensis TaxID=89050 RepID=UPI000AD2FCC0|nr:alpha/beta hydrolase [Actinacidiphila yeochonensis]
MTPVSRRLSPVSLRALLALAVLCVMVSTTGWTAVRPPAAEGARAAAVAAWMTGSAGLRQLPAPTSPPAAISHFFASLTAAQRARLAERYPLVVGNLDGVSPTLRYRANRLALAEQQTRARRLAHSGELNFSGQRQASELATRYASLLTPGRQILAFDPTGSGLVAEVFGDLSTARRVAVVVPGSDTDVLDFESANKPYEAPVGMGQALYEAERREAPDAHTAVIAWAGYTAPVGLGLDASTGTLAERGAPRLESLLASLPRRATVSLFCHSYGSVLCGVAAPHLPHGRVRDLAVFGSPGMRADRVSDLRTTAHVWAARDSGDWISDVPYVEFAGLGHGADPVSAAFGARVLSAAGADGHSGYFAPGSTSLADFADIALGRYGSVVCRSGASCTTGLR